MGSLPLEEEMQQNLPHAIKSPDSVPLDLIPDSLDSSINIKYDDEGGLLSQGFIEGMLMSDPMSGIPPSKPNSSDHEGLGLVGPR
jgi:hypothetical protein